MNRSVFKLDLDWLHSLFQELESQDVELPMGDYMTVYRIIEDTREVFSDD